MYSIKLPRLGYVTADNLFFTSDTHYGHENIMKLYCPNTRGHYANTDEMDADMIAKWNQKATSDSIVFHLGDFSMYDKHQRNHDILNQLVGLKIMILGNHDKMISRSREQYKKHFAFIGDYLEIKVGDDQQRVVMHHFPYGSWHGMHRGSWNLHGHSHGTYPPFGKQLDVGCDSYFFENQNTCRLISYNEIETYMNAREIQCKDGHTVRLTKLGLINS